MCSLQRTKNFSCRVLNALIACDFGELPHNYAAYLPAEPICHDGSNARLHTCRGKGIVSKIAWQAVELGSNGLNSIMNACP